MVVENRPFRHFKAFCLVLAISILLPLTIHYATFITVAPASVSLTQSVKKIQVLEDNLISEQRMAWHKDLQIMHQQAKKDQVLVKKYLITGYQHGFILV